MINFNKLDISTSLNSPIDPIDIFRTLKINDEQINDLWLGQGDTLRLWNKDRCKKDIGIALNTGAGKTLVGLLIAQSLVNETKGKVLYACSSIQLVQQTAEKASGYGFDVSTYFQGEFSNEETFQRCTGPCITTYQALFNGRSIFSREVISAIIFDDAHAAEQLLRNYFSVQIEKSEFEHLYSEIFALFSEYFTNVGKTATAREIRDGRARDQLLLVHPSEVFSQHQFLVGILSGASLDTHEKTLFSWAHIKDHIDQCCLIVSPSKITITPPFLPSATLSYFDNSVRRVYLSATLATHDGFARTFGRVPTKIVSPPTTAGECERLIVIPSKIDGDSNSLKFTKEVVHRRKTLILVPSYARAERWDDIVQPPPVEEVSYHVSKFKKDRGSSKLLLAARYDGLDLPGDTCRLMVIDDLPVGMGPLEQYLWRYLEMDHSFTSTITSRLIQSFGRISRGLSDYGVVILTGKRLLHWLFNPNNASMLPGFLQKQLAVGDQVSDQFCDVDSLEEAIEACLNRNEDWLNAYDLSMKHKTTSIVNEEQCKTLVRLALAEAKYAESAWNRDFEKASQALANTLKLAYSLSTGTGAWHSLWIGYAQERIGKHDSATDLYVKAHADQNNIPMLSRQRHHNEFEDFDSQTTNVSNQFDVTANGEVKLPKSIDKHLLYLNGQGSTNKTDEALRALGQHLGLLSTRPDNDFGVGPDVLWRIEEGPALCIETKTQKRDSSTYNKNDVGQMHNHIQWVRDNCGDIRVIPLFIGPLVKASDKANFPSDFLVSTLAAFEDLGQRLRRALIEVAQNVLPLTLSSQLNDVFEDRKLIYPEVLDTLDFHKLRDL